MFAKLRAFADDDSGATAIEYGLIAALISVAGLTTFQLAGDTISEVWFGANAMINDTVR